MKRPLALIGISYFISLMFLNLVPDKFVPFLGCVFVALFFISIIFKKLRVGWTLPLCFGACIVATIIYGIGIINVNKIQKLNNQEAAVSGTIYGIYFTCFHAVFLCVLLQHLWQYRQSSHAA